MSYSGPEAQLEKWMAELGESRYSQRQQEAYDKKREGTAGATRRLVAHALDSMTEGLEEYLRTKRKSGKRLKSHPLILTVGAEVASLITCRVVLDQVSRKVEYHQLVRSIGKGIQDEARWKHYRKEQGPLFRKLIKKLTPLGKKVLIPKLRSAIEAKGVTFAPWTIEERVQVGATLIEMFIATTGLVEITKGFSWDKPKYGKGRLWPRTEKLVGATEETVKWLKRSHEQHAAAMPVHLPMVDKPIEWVGLRGGGYATDFFVQRPLIRCSLPKHKDFYSEIAQPVLNAVNKVQDVAWSINEDVLEVMGHFWENNIDAAGMGYANSEPIPPKGVLDTEEKLKAWKLKAHLTHRRNHLTRSRRLLTGRVIWVAKQFLTKTFYFPQQLDSRGRMYPRPYALQPQGDDQSRGLLRFSEGKALGSGAGLMWFCIHGANTFGTEKGTLAARELWVVENQDKILAVFEDPLANRWWEEAKEPWQFLAWCLEYGDFRSDPANFVSYLPCQMDGSNNGLQLYSLLLRDKTLAEWTNVAPTKEPEDIYLRVGEILKGMLEADEDPLAKEWLALFDGKIPRDLCKRPVMTLVYGVTLWSSTTYVLGWYEDLHDVSGDHPMGQTHRQKCKYLATKLWAATKQAVSSAVVAMDWLRKVSDICSQNDVPLYWTAPSGFQVFQEYTKYKRQSVKTTLGDSSLRFCKIRKHNDEISSRAQRQGFPPNFVHSLDAAIMTEVVNRMTAPVNIIHDSFGTHAVDCEELAMTIRQVISEIFSEDLLTKLAQELILRLPEGVTLPPTPPLGDFNPTAILQATYSYA